MSSAGPVAAGGRAGGSLPAMAASAGSFSHLVDEDFILDKRVVGGMQRVSERLIYVGLQRLSDAIKLLGGEVVRLAAVVECDGFSRQYGRS